MSPGCCRRFAASITISVLITVLAVPHVVASPPASWGGRVFDGDRATPRGGVVVRLGGEPGSGTVRSDPTRADGSFVIESAPPGTYTLAVETAEGVFVSSERVELHPGSNTPLALGLRQPPIFASQDYGFGSEEIPRAVEYVVGGLVVLFSLFVLHKLFEDNDEQTSTVVLPGV